MKTKAAILYELNKPLRIEEVEIPLLGYGQVLVRILFSSVCQTQVNEMKGIKGPDKYLPHMMGHEASALVQETGPGVTRVKPNDYVVLSWLKGPGLEAPSTQYSLGSKKINSGAITTFNEFSIISENRITKIPNEVPADVAALLGCAVPTGAGMVKNTLKAEPGSSIAVFGLGGVGLSAVMYASTVGCKPIIAVDIHDSKLRLAQELGATHTINAAREPTLEVIRGITGVGVDYAIESSGVKEVMELAFESTKFIDYAIKSSSLTKSMEHATKSIKLGGTTVLAGNIRKGEKVAIDPYALMAGKKILGTWGGETKTDEDIPFYAEEYLMGRLKLVKLVTHRYNLEDINIAFAEIEKGVVGRALIKLGD